MEAGIVGLPYVGKTSVFNSLTSLGVGGDSAASKPNVGVVAVPDPRLEIICRHIETKKVVPATLQLVDVAGLVAGASEGKLEGAAALGIAEDIIEKLEKMRPANTSSRPQCKILHGEAEASSSEDEEGNHRVDVMGTWVMECQKPSLLKYLDISLFKAMPAINAIDAFYFSQTAQIFERLTPASKRLSW